MKIEIELPDWCDENSYIYIMKGIELVAYKWPNQPLKIKTGRCHRCGKCCYIGFPKQLCEHCKQTGEEWMCDLGSERPWSCSVHQPIMRKGCEDCSEKFE